MGFQADEIQEEDVRELPDGHAREVHHLHGILRTNFLLILPSS